jgi:hypothetical protein
VTERVVPWRGDGCVLNPGPLCATVNNLVSIRCRGFHGDCALRSHYSTQHCQETHVLLISKVAGRAGRDRPMASGPSRPARPAQPGHCTAHLPTALHALLGRWPGPKVHNWCNMWQLGGVAQPAPPLPSLSIMTEFYLNTNSLFDTIAGSLVPSQQGSNASAGPLGGEGGVQGRDALYPAAAVAARCVKRKCV